MKTQIDYKIINLKVGTTIEQIRTDKNMTQEKLAKEVKMNRCSIANMESGRQAINLSKLYDIAFALGVSPASLLPNMGWYQENKNKKLRKVVSIEVIEDLS
jgi:transcriptional regulator with XRE-family HTH domain